MRVDDMGINQIIEGESGEGKVDGVESPDQSDGAKKEEKESDNAHARQRKEKGENKQSAAQEEHNLNTEATFLYDSLLGQIDELLGTLHSCPS